MFDQDMRKEDILYFLLCKMTYFIYEIKPVDERTLRGIEIPAQYEDLLKRIDAKKAELEKRRPLTQGELERLREEFLLEFT